jgi:3-phytase
VQPALASAAVADDADDPAIWINRADPARSLVVATNKVKAPGGALYVYALDGTVKQVVASLDRPNNVDVEYGLATPGGPVDIAVAAERLQSRLRVYRIDASGLAPIDGGGVPVLQGETAEAAMPMGISVYRRQKDGALFAIVAPKTGPATGYLWQYRLAFDERAGAVRATMVRRFGRYSGTGEIEAVAVDDERGYVYYADEEFGIRKWHADPDAGGADRELAVFGTNGFTQQREGIAILETADGGYVVCNDQIPGRSVLHVFPRDGQPGRPHDHEPALASIVTAADTTDGIDAVSRPLGPRFPRGLLVMMNSAGRNFQFYDAGAIADRIAQAVRARPLH